MNPQDLRSLLRGVAAGKLTVADAVRRLRDLPFEDLGYARVDHHRHLRRGMPEVVFGEGKSAAQCAGIVSRIAAARQPVLVTRASREQFEAIRRTQPKAVWHEQARVITLRVAVLDTTSRKRPKSKVEDVVVVTAGTSDIAVAEEAVLTAEILGASAGRLYDVGVAGLHRLVGERKRLERAEVIVVAAGMEGALPGVVAGMVGTPVIGLPTSVGYGVSVGGLTALFGMLASCAGGLTVVNIDNGFGAGFAAAMIVARSKKRRSRRMSTR